jgi:triacylglycerol esterase/lipase EstA (alpha/beta hydrolase family)
VADLLASQGYLVISISANSINAQDGDKPDAGVGARSRLIRHHLSLWSTWNRVGGDPWNNTFVGKVDMKKVVLVGHSRGGEGVHRAAIDATPTDPYKIVGLVSYGPTAFGEQVTPDVHSATILRT